GGDVVVDEQGAGVPGEGVGVGLRVADRPEVALALDALGAAEGEDLAGAVPGPLERVAVVGHAQVVDLALFHQAQGRLPRGGRHGVERAALAVLAPDPAPALPLAPALHLRLAALLLGGPAGLGPRLVRRPGPPRRQVPQQERPAQGQYAQDATLPRHDD